MTLILKLALAMVLSSDDDSATKDETELHRFSQLSVCEYEDGNTSGQPCVWTDPDTGTRYYVDSSEYRN